MAPLVFSASRQRKLPNLAAYLYLAASLCFAAPVALAQHGGGGHSGGGGHFGGHSATSAHATAPHATTTPRTRAGVPGFRSSGPPPAGFGAIGFRFTPRPIRPRTGLPIVPFPVFFGGPFFGFYGGFWPGFGFNSLWWPGCDPLWGWGYGCNASPYYGYGLGGGYISPYSPSYVAPPEYVPPPAYPYSEEEARERPRLYLKDGSVYVVTDYWLVHGQIHFTTIEEGGAKSVEHAIPFDDLDLQRTIDVNTRLGFRFVLRNAPVEQYLQQNRPAPNPPPDAP